MFIIVFVCGGLMSIYLVDKLLCSCLKSMGLLIVQLSINHAHGPMHGRHFWASFNGVAEVNLSSFGLDVAVFARAGVGACTAPSSSLWLETPSRLRVSAAVTPITTEATSTRARATERTLVTNCSLLFIGVIVTRV